LNLRERVVNNSRVLSFEAILFDNDGVLVDTERLYFQANRELLARVGIALDEAAYVELFLRDNLGAWHLAEARGVTREAITALRVARDRRYLELLAATDILIPGVAPIVSALERRYRMGIVTSSERESFTCAHARTGLLPHFEFALTRPDYTHSKPHPEPYLRAVERLALPADRCLVIEDSQRGLASAKAAGLCCWVIPSSLTRGLSFAGADAVLPDLAAAAERLLPSS
jgi:HAD superfamily hydrolase (TIGR01509 family)